MTEATIGSDATPDPWSIEIGDGPVVATAIHDGALVRADVERQMAISASERRREEDPCTGDWTALGNTRVIGHRSRFEFDLNRPRAKAVYATPADAWGLKVWRSELSAEALSKSLELYDRFYAEMEAMLERLVAIHGRVVVYDLHSYNHRRGGPSAPADDARLNPEVNLGTGTMNGASWRGVTESFLAALRAYDFLGRRLDVRENVRFRGGRFPEWIHRRFPASVCALSIEIKKFYMDEWTGWIDEPLATEVGRALAATVPCVTAHLRKL